jgi:hypothetical protein
VNGPPVKLPQNPANFRCTPPSPLDPLDCKKLGLNKDGSRDLPLAVKTIAVSREAGSESFIRLTLGTFASRISPSRMRPQGTI